MTVLGTGELADAVFRDYPPWEAHFIDGSSIHSGGRAAHLSFRDAVLSRGDALSVFWLHLPISDHQTSTTFDVGVALLPQFDDQVPAGSFFFSSDSGWGVPPQWEPSLRNMRVIYWRRASMQQVVTVSVERGRSVTGAAAAPPANTVEYAAHIIGWEATRSDESLARCALHCVPVISGGSVVDWKLDFKDRV